MLQMETTEAPTAPAYIQVLYNGSKLSVKWCYAASSPSWDTAVLPQPRRQPDPMLLSPPACPLHAFPRMGARRQGKPVEACLHSTEHDQEQATPCTRKCKSTSPLLPILGPVTPPGPEPQSNPDRPCPSPEAGFAAHSQLIFSFLGSTATKYLSLGGSNS